MATTTTTSLKTQRSKRRRYAPEVIDAVREHYPHLRTREDREEFAHQHGIGSIQRLYNLACRLDVTSEESEFAARDRAMDPARRRLRQDPGETTFSASDDGFIARNFRHHTIEEIAYHLAHTETAVAYRARHLGLRNPARHFDLEKVVDWLGIDGTALRSLGVDVHRCCDRRGRVRIILVETMQLARALGRGGCWQRLIAAGADAFFIREVIESALAVRQGSADWEPLWVSHGYTWMNPISNMSFGLFYDPADEKLIGRDITPEELSPERVHQLR